MPALRCEGPEAIGNIGGDNTQALIETPYDIGMRNFMDIISKSPASLEQAIRPTLLEAVVEIIAKVSAVGCGAIFVTCLASAAQVWQYPYPRGLLLLMAFSAGGIALFSSFALVFLAFGRAALIKYGPLSHEQFRRLMFCMACLCLVAIVTDWPMFRANAHALADCGWRAETMDLCNRPLEKLQSDTDKAEFEAEARKRLGPPRQWYSRFYSWLKS
jgi:hypothetical protein